MAAKGRVWREPGVRKREKDHALLQCFLHCDKLVFVALYGACCKPWHCHSANKSVGLCLELSACLFFFSKPVSFSFLFLLLDFYSVCITVSLDYSSFNLFLHSGPFCNLK